jgi:hypothetical protein
MEDAAAELANEHPGHLRPPALLLDLQPEAWPDSPGMMPYPDEGVLLVLRCSPHGVATNAVEGQELTAAVGAVRSEERRASSQTGPHVPRPPWGCKTGELHSSGEAARRGHRMLAEG